jgi:benzoyl-CoA reductase/2-hydroxyglutaryl-CoA dehydratase subunit BcrC/BadD/HgdB
MIGWVCSYTPVEIINALGLPSFRLFGDSSPTSLYLPSNFCPYSRSCFSEVLEKDEQLTGVILLASCHAQVHLYNALTRYYTVKGKRFFCYLLDLPRLGWGGVTSSCIDYWVSCFSRLIEQLCQFYDVEWNQESFLKAVERQQQVRNLLRQLYDLQRDKPGLLRAEGVLGLVRFACQREPDEVIGILEETLSLLRGESGSPRNRQVQSILGSLLRRSAQQGPKLILAGSPFPLALVHLVEEMGGIIVGDELCQGYRFCLVETNEEINSLPSLARSYLQRFPCSRMLRFPERFLALQQLVKERCAQGIIYHSLKFCDLYHYESALLHRKLAELGIPVLFLETENRLGGMEQMRTRIQAFLEMIC